MRRIISFLLLVIFLLIGPAGLLAQRGYRYALVLEDPPLAAHIFSRKQLRHAVAEERLRTIEAAQAKLRSELENRKIHVTGTVQTLLNAVFVHTSEDRQAELRGLPGVRRVEYLPPIRLHLDQAAILVNAHNAWTTFGGLQEAGKGMKIGILDTGIDHQHPAFQDILLFPPAGFPKCQPQDCAYTNNKVIVARSYVNMLAEGWGDTPNEIAATSRPDDLSPRDRVGHGTAAAMIAAGVQNTDPSTTITITGVAPKAYLGNYKISGSPGVNDYTFASVVIDALEDAFLDEMDVVSLSIGSPALYGPLDAGSTCGETGSNPCDIRADAVQNAVNMGLNVVVSAGNDGDIGNRFPTLNTLATPGTAPAAITVGASTNAHVFFASVRVPGGGSNLERIDALFGDGPRPTSPLEAPLKDVSKLGNNGLACTALAQGSLTGSIALIQRGDCFFSVKVNNAQAAGAVGVVIFDNEASSYPFPPAGLTDTGIPAVLIGGVAGQALKSFLATNPDRPVTLDPTLTAVEAEFDTVAFFSSRGPSIGNFAIKPELVAVGTDIYTATQKYDPNSGLYDPTGYTPVQGTSFSAPMAAGAAALVKQRKPAYTPLQVKSALVNAATNNVDDDSEIARVTAVGAGKLNVNAAVLSPLVVDPPVLSFGVIGPDSLPLSPELDITNTGGVTLSLNLTVVRRDSDAITQVVLNPNVLNLNPGQAGSVTVRLSGARPVPGSYEGAISISAPSAGVSLRVPYLYLVGDGFPHNVFPVLGDGFEGVVGERIPGSLIGLKLVDQYGVPVSGASVVFRAPPGGFIEAADETTDVYGIAAALVYLGSQLGEQRFTADVGGLTTEFNGIARLRPTIFANGVVNAATGKVGQGLAPGSYMSIYGQALSPTTRVFNTPYLPISLANVSVSFDVPSRDISLPGRLHFVSEDQINVQIPWELEGLNSVKIKVSIGDISGDVYDLPLARNSPGIFPIRDPSTQQWLAAALHPDYSLITTGDPASRGEVVQVFGNGFGPVNNRPPTGEITPAPPPLLRTTDPVTVTIGGRQVIPDFSGLSPYSVALYQVNFKVPDDTPAGLQPLVITVNGVSSEPVNLPVQ